MVNKQLVKKYLEKKAEREAREKKTQKVTFRLGSKTTLMSCITIAFVALKLTGNIAWPWLWIFCPIWVPIVTLLALPALLAAMALVVLVAGGILFCIICVIALISGFIRSLIRRWRQE